MNDFSLLAPLIHSYMDEHTKRLCQESGKVCPHWLDDKIYEDLKYLDKKDGGERAKEYYNKCHSPHLIFRPAYNGNEAQCIVRCRLNDLRVPDKCDYTNEEVANQVLEELKGKQLIE